MIATGKLLLKQAKENCNLNRRGLAAFLGVTEKTIYNWSKHDNWPSWALRKCGMLALNGGNYESLYSRHSDKNN